MKPWKTLSRQIGSSFGKFLTVEIHSIQLPDGRIIRNWPWLVSPDFVLVLARSADGRFLCFRQTKYAVKGTTLAPVGGHVDPGESPLAAAKRELREETGHLAKRWIRLGSFANHANRGMGRGHLYLALDAHPHGKPTSDDLEEQELLFLSRRQLERALDRNEFKILAWTAAIALAVRYLDKKETTPCSRPASSTPRSTRS